MRNHITPEILANSVRMNRTQFSGSFLILEGDKDARFFRTYIEPSKCRIVNAINKDNAVRLLDILESESFIGVLAVVDADFDILEGKIPTSSNLLLTDYHDLEIMLFNSQALEKVLIEFGSVEKIVNFEQRIETEIRTALFEAGRIIGYLRWLSLQQRLGLDFEDLSFNRFLDEGSLKVDTAALIRAVKDHSQLHNLDDSELIRDLENLMSNNQDMLQICCGHDISAVLSFGLRKIVGSNNAGDVKQEIIERSLRLAFEAPLFSATQLYSSIKLWEQNNQPFIILRGN
jgi:hypothetical protein